jgi:hypothetical protein
LTNFRFLELVMEEARLRPDTLRQQLAADAAALGAANSRRNDLVRRRHTDDRYLVGFGDGGEPDGARVEAQRSANRIGLLTERQRRTISGYCKWLQDEVLRERRHRVAQRITDLGADSDAAGSLPCPDGNKQVNRPGSNVCLQGLLSERDGAGAVVVNFVATDVE